MKIHVIRSEEVPESFYDEVMSMMEAFTDSAEFTREDTKLRWQDDELEDIDWEDEEYFVKKQPKLSKAMDMAFEMPYLESPSIVTWPDIFTKTADYRQRNLIPDEEYIVLLTTHANEYNWFSAGNPDGSMDFFIHTGMWDKFLDCDPRFPVAYELISIPLQVAMFGSYHDLEKNSHKQAKGCLNDFCRDKREIVLKMRTGDICPDCADIIKERNVDPSLTDQAFKVFDSIRSHMLFRERYKITKKPYRLEIRGNNKRFYLPELTDRRIPLSPIERAVYLLVLNHPEGIPFSHFPDYFDVLKKYYSSTSVEGSVATINARVTAICENHDSQLSIIFSKIKAKFIKLVGEDMAESYAVKGQRGEPRKIGLDIGLVSETE